MWADFGPVGNIEKKNWVDYEQFFEAVFFMFPGTKFFQISFKNIIASTLKSCVILNFFLPNGLNIFNLL